VQRRACRDTRFTYLILQCTPPPPHTHTQSITQQQPEPTRATKNVSCFRRVIGVGGGHNSPCKLFDVRGTWAVRALVLRHKSSGARGATAGVCLRHDKLETQARQPATGLRIPKRDVGGGQMSRGADIARDGGIGTRRGPGRGLPPRHVTTAGEVAPHVEVRAARRLLRPRGSMIYSGAAAGVPGHAHHAFNCARLRPPHLLTVPPHKVSHNNSPSQREQ